ncbi:Tyrosine--tRNA ligase cytoplasmic, partial [Coemansia sp. RSA 475]
FVVLRPEQYGGNTVYTDYASLESDFAEEKVHPGDLKSSVAAAINTLLDPIREHFESAEMQQLLLEAYPPPAAKPKAVKQKKKHNKRPDAVDAEAKAEAGAEVKAVEEQLANTNLD